MAAIQIDSSYTQQVRALVTSFYDVKNRVPNIVADATSFFLTLNSVADQRDQLELVIANAKNEEQLNIAKSKLTVLEKKIIKARHDRVARLNDFIDRLLALTESNSDAESNNATAKFLGTLMLITDCTRSGFAKQHKILKPLYKVALTLRLADALLAQGNIKHAYLGKYIDSQLRYKDNPHWQVRWRKELAYPLVKAALLQDIGLYHPDAQLILLGKSNLLKFQV